MLDYFVELAAFDELHAEVALAIALTDFVDGNNAWMFEVGSGFCFPAKTLQMRFSGPGTEAPSERHSAIETFLMGAINNALTASADFLQQLIVAKVPEYFCPPRDGFAVANCSRGSLSIVYANAFFQAGIGDASYSVLVKQTKTTLQKTSRANFLCGVTGDSRSAPSANARH